jgi:hypothetical protein
LRSAIAPTAVENRRSVAPLTDVARGS